MKPSDNAEPEGVSDHPKSRYSEDSFKIASIACQLSKGEIPDESHLIEAMQTLSKSELLLRIAAGRDVKAITEAPFISFEEAIKLSVGNDDLFNFGKITTLRGLKKKITAYFLSESELERVSSYTVSGDELNEEKKRFTYGAKSGEIQRIVACEKCGISEEKARYYRIVPNPRSSELILKSSLLSGMEGRHLSEQTHKIGGFNT